MKINPYKFNVNNNYPTQKTSSKKPAFKSRYEINGDSIYSRQQVFTLGMLMSNFWIWDARNTFYDIRLKDIRGKFDIRVNDSKDFIVEKILTKNRIEFKKIENKNHFY